MATMQVMTEVDTNRLLEMIQNAAETITNLGSQVTLDFSAVPRVGPPGLKALETLASVAEAKSVKPILLGVRVDVYKVLKLAGLASRFAYLS